MSGDAIVPLRLVALNRAMDVGQHEAPIKLIAGESA